MLSMIACRRLGSALCHTCQRWVCRLPVVCRLRGNRLLQHVTLLTYDVFLNMAERLSLLQVMPVLFAVVRSADEALRLFLLKR